MKRELEGVQAFGTDGEEQLVKALSHEFPCALHLLCFLHFKRNIKQELSKRGLGASSQSSIMKDIFGRQVESIHEDGLVDCTSAEEFHEKLEACKTRWEAVEEECAGCHKGFHRWFVQYKSNLIEGSMLRNIRVEAGLGDPPEEFTTNSCESMNATLKAEVNHKKSDVPQFVKKMQDLVDEQRREMECAVINRGKYAFQQEYKYFEIPESRWFRMSSEQRNRHLQKVVSTRPGNLQGSLCGTSMSSVRADGDALCVGIGDLPRNLSVPLASLEGIWIKAAELVSSSNSIVPAPGHPPEAKMVASRSGSRPHLVTKGKDGLFHCDSECANYRSLKMCSHVVAVAQVNEELFDFVELFAKKKQQPNLTRLAVHGMPTGRGRKGQQPPRKKARKQPIESSAPFQPCAGTSYSQAALHDELEEPSLTSISSLAVGMATPTLSPSSCSSHTGNPWQVQYNSPSFIQCFPPPSASYPSQYVPYPHPPLSSGPFFVTFISGNISVYAGCHNRCQTHCYSI